MNDDSSEEEGEVITSHRVNDNSFAPLVGASHKRRRHLISVVENPQEEKEELIAFNRLGHAPQAVAKTSSRGSLSSQSLVTT